MPFEQVYQPIFHTFVAALAGLSGFSIARAYHFLVGLTYALGPVTLYWLATRLTSSVPIGFTTGLLYSLVSPACLLVPEIARDTAGAYFGRRLHTALAYSDTPNIAALTLLPVVILLLDIARTRRSRPAWIAAAFAMAVIALTNIPATLALGMALMAYALAYATREFWWQIAAAALAGGLLAVGWFPPSIMQAVNANLGRYELANRVSAYHYLGFAITGVALFFAARGVRRLRVHPSIAFGGFFVLLAGGVPLLNYWGGITALAQPRRFQIAMEIPIAFLAAIAMVRIYQMTLARSGNVLRFAAVGIAILLTGFQIQNLRNFARREIRPIDATQLSEYRTAKWLEANAPGQRVYAAGSTMYWLNAFADIPQVTGCCEQSIALPVTQMMRYTMGSDDHAGDRAFAVSLAWLQALGANYVMVPGPGSTDVYKWDWVHPDKFAGLLQEVTRDGGNIVYAVPQRSTVPAHLVFRQELLSRYPENGLDVDSLATYVRAIEDPTRPAVSMIPSADPRVMDLDADLTGGFQISVQVPYHPGWHATMDGKTIPIGKDAIGLMVIEPGVAGPARIRLSFEDWPEQTLCRVISYGTLLVLLFGLVRPGRRKLT